MTLRPIKDRILVKPELPPTETESGLIMAEHRKPEQTGTVIAVGPCAHPLKAEADAFIAEYYDPECSAKHDDCSWCQIVDLLQRATQREPAVKPGDYVVFSWTGGQEIWVENGSERYLMMTENDILCVVEGLEA